MQKTVLHRHRAIGVVAFLSLSGVGIAACSPATNDAAAPVYLMGTVAPDMFGKVSPVMRHSVASASIERTEIAATATPTGEPIALAPSLTASAAAAQPASDVVPLDDPPAPAKPAAKPALLVANPAPMSARFMPAPNLSASMLEPAPAETAAQAGDAAHRCCICTACPDSGPAACHDGGGTASYRAERRRIGARRARPGSGSCSSAHHGHDPARRGNCAAGHLRGAGAGRYRHDRGDHQRQGRSPRPLPAALLLRALAAPPRRRSPAARPE